MPPRFIAQQLSRPTGLLGRIVAALMNQHNAKMNAFVIEQMDINSADRVLEIGFGGGLNLPFLISKAGYVAALDASHDMVERAKKRFADAIGAGQAGVFEGSVEALPFGSAQFTKTCTVNTIYFWRSLDAGFAEIHRVLTDGGHVYLGFLPKTWMDKGRYPNDIFTSRTPDEVIASLHRCGFADICIQQPAPTIRWKVVVAKRAK